VCSTNRCATKGGFAEYERIIAWIVAQFADNSSTTTSLPSNANGMLEECAMNTWFTVIEGGEYSGFSRDTGCTACNRREMRHARVGRATNDPPQAGVERRVLEQHTRRAAHARRPGRSDSGLRVPPAARHC
jgi:hypothetical protein